MNENFTAWPTKRRESAVAQRAASTLPYEGPRRTELAAARIALSTGFTTTNVDSTATKRNVVFLSCDELHPQPQMGHALSEQLRLTLSDLTHSYRILCRMLTNFWSTFVHYTVFFTGLINQQMNVVKYVYK